MDDVWKLEHRERIVMLYLRRRKVITCPLYVNFSWILSQNKVRVLFIYWAEKSFYIAYLLLIQRILSRRVPFQKFCYAPSYSYSSLVSWTPAGLHPAQYPFIQHKNTSSSLKSLLWKLDHLFTPFLFPVVFLLVWFFRYWDSSKQ